VETARKERVKIRVPREARLVRFLMSPIGKAILGFCFIIFTIAGFTFTYYYVQYAKVIDQKLRGGPFTATSKIFAAPETVAVGDPGTPTEVAASLRRAGYSESRSNNVGSYNVHPDSVEIFPGPDSYFNQEPGVIRFAKDHIVRIISLSDNTDRTQFSLEPELLTNVYDKSREKQRIVHYGDIPQRLIHAIISVEDKRFFQHAGFDPIRIIRSAMVDVQQGRNAQGGSTLTMQLAKSLFLTQERTWRRKLPEIMITLQLEQRLTKQQILELYVNQIDLGRRGSFEIRGFGAAARAYFGKDLHALTLEQTATLAGMLNNPSIYSPFRHADRALERRNLVLSLMRTNGYINDRDYAVAIDKPMVVASAEAESSEAPYYVDMVNDELNQRFEDYDFKGQSDKIYTALDLNLQRAAAAAIKIGMQNVDDQIRKQRRFKGMNPPLPQCALIALDPHTGQILALAGGRNYGASQLNHVLAKRQPGSIFKPFVYAAAMNTAINGGTRTITPATTVVDEPTTFWYDGKPYEPSNFGQKFYGVVTLRQALARSMNIATIKVAEMVGYGTVVALAHKAGINTDVHGTPSSALGSYDSTPMEMAGAYTVFANGGTYVKPSFLALVKEQNGTVLYQHKPEPKPVLDPRVNYLMVSMMEEVLRSGTGAGVHAMGFNLPAAGKTGTSHDGWFAGFTSNLLCIVWVGFDDYKQLDLEGARSALPIWAEFMRRAAEFRAYRDVKNFQSPSGVASIQIDPESGMPATAQCPKKINEVFISGTEPVGSCPLHGGGSDNTNVSGWDAPPAPRPSTSQPQFPQQQQQPRPTSSQPQPQTIRPTAGQPRPPSESPSVSAAQSQPPEPADAADHDKKKKKGFFGRIFRRD
jgi:penicillin-binding protein 1B